MKNKTAIISIIAFISLMIAAYLLLNPNPYYGNCEECGISWKKAESPHMIRVSDNRSVFYVCDECWTNLTELEKQTYKDIAFLEGNNISYIDRMVKVDSVNIRVEIHKLINYDGLGEGNEEPRFEIAYNVGVYDTDGRCTKKLLLKYRKCRSDKFIEVMKEIEYEINQMITRYKNRPLYTKPEAYIIYKRKGLRYVVFDPYYTVLDLFETLEEANEYINKEANDNLDNWINN